MRPGEVTRRPRLLPQWIINLNNKPGNSMGSIHSIRSVSEACRHQLLLSLLFFFLVFSEAVSQQPAPDLASYVNTLQGTNSSFELTYGNTYPTTALPFGMHTWTPQTGENGDGWKYQYSKDSIRGFQQAHQCSSWSGDY